MASRTRSFDFAPGTLLAGKYRVTSRLGTGWEGEVYRVIERGTRIERAAKLFYPRRNVGNRAARFAARKLHELRACPIVIHYHTEERIEIGGDPVTMTVSELVEGELLSEFLVRQRGKRLDAFQGLHLLYALVRGIEPIHRLGEYHGDLHSDNVIVSGFGLEFDLKLFDVYRRDGTPAANRRDDVCDLVYIFHEALGGPRRYAGHPQQVKDICRGLKRSLILKSFPTVAHLRRHIERLAW